MLPVLMTVGLGLGACSAGGAGPVEGAEAEPTTTTVSSATDPTVTAPTAPGSGGSVDADQSDPAGQPSGPTAGGESPTEVVDCGSGGVVKLVGPAPVEAIARRGAELFLASCPRVSFTIDRSDADLGFALLCAGMADVVGAARAPSDDEVAQCDDAGIELVSLPLAREALVVVTGRANTGLACLGFADLYALLGPESVGYGQWSDAADLAEAVGAGDVAYPDARLEIFGPADGDADRLGFEEIVLAPIAAGQGVEPVVRSDLIGGRDVSRMVEAVGSSERGLGWMSYDLAMANAGAVTTVDLRLDGEHECVAATEATVSDGTYPASRRLTLWLPAEPDGTVRSFVNFLYGGGTYPVVVGSANGTTGYLTLPESERAAALAAWPQP